jgi:hypothetical protein
MWSRPADRPSGPHLRRARSTLLTAHHKSGIGSLLSVIASHVRSSITFGADAPFHLSPPLLLGFVQILVKSGFLLPSPAAAHHRAGVSRWAGIRWAPPTRVESPRTKLSSEKFRRHAASGGDHRVERARLPSPRRLDLVDRSARRRLLRGTGPCGPTGNETIVSDDEKRVLAVGQPGAFRLDIFEHTNETDRLPKSN